MLVPYNNYKKWMEEELAKIRESIEMQYEDSPNPPAEEDEKGYIKNWGTIIEIRPDFTPTPAHPSAPIFIRNYDLNLSDSTELEGRNDKEEE